MKLSPPASKPVVKPGQLGDLGHAASPAWSPGGVCPPGVLAQLPSQLGCGGEVGHLGHGSFTLAAPPLDHDAQVCIMNNLRTGNRTVYASTADKYSAVRARPVQIPLTARDRNLPFGAILDW